MVEQETRKKKKGGGLFGRKKKRKDGASVSTMGDASGAGDGDGHRQKKKGFGARIKRIVGGRKRRGSKSAADEDGVSLYVDQDDPNYKGPRTALDPDMLAKVMEEESPAKASQNGIRFGSVPPISEEESVDEDRFPEDDLGRGDGDRMSYGEAEGDGFEEDQGDLSGPISLVLLLVDPDTLRFELLQLEFETPQDAKVADVLEQIKSSVTEPAIQSLEFHALVDCKGGQFSANAALAKAVTNRRRSKDILIGLSKGVTTEHCGRLARPILSDQKVIGMLEINEYNVRGWTKDEKEQSKLRDAKVDSFRTSERKHSTCTFSVVGGAFLALFLIYHLATWYFGPIPLSTIHDVVQDVVQNMTGANFTNFTGDDSSPNSSIPAETIEPELIIDAATQDS